MLKNRHTTISYIVVILFGLVLFYVGTDGFKAFTAETARLNKLKEEKPLFPQVTLEDSKGRTYSLSEFENKYVLITFLYTSCGTVCPQLEKNMAELYERLPQYIGKDILFLSISFDPTRDDPDRLETYRKAFGSDGDTWRMARIVNMNELDLLLKRFGVIVIPDGNGNFTHNSAFYLVDKTGKLSEVMDYTKIEEAADQIATLIEGEKENKK
ncbi:SCO family protein [Robertmurraya sp. GLU-23]